MMSFVLFIAGFALICGTRVRRMQSNVSEVIEKQLQRYGYMGYAILLLAFLFSYYNL